MSKLDLQALETYRQNKLAEQQARNPVPPQGALADVVDVTQKGLYDGAAGIGEMVGLDSVRDWGQEGAAEQLRTISPVGQQAMQKTFFDENTPGTVTMGDAWTDPRAIAMQFGHTLGLNADILMGGGAIKAGKMAVTSVAKEARKRMLAQTGDKVLADEAAAAATQSFMKKQFGDKADMISGYAGDTLAFGAAGHAVSGGLGAIDIGAEVESMDFEELVDSPQFVQLVKQNKQMNPGMPADELLAQSRSELAEISRTAVKTNPALLTSNLLVGGLGTAALTRIFSGAMPKGAGISAEFATEAAQGGIEQFAKNQVVQENIDPTQALDEGMTAAALNEGVMGAGMGAATAGAGALYQKAQNALKKDQPPAPVAEAAPAASVLPDIQEDPELYEPLNPGQDPMGAFAQKATEVSKTHPHVVDVIGEIALAEPEKAKAAVSVLDNFMASPDFARRTVARMAEYMRDPAATAEPDAQEQQDVQSLISVIGRQDEGMAQQLKTYVEQNPAKTTVALTVASRYLADPEFRPKAETQIANYLQQQSQPVANTEQEPAIADQLSEEMPIGNIPSDADAQADIDSLAYAQQTADFETALSADQMNVDAVAETAPAAEVDALDAYKEASTYVRSLPIDQRGKVTKQMLKDTFGIDDDQALELMPWEKLSTKTVGNSENDNEIKAAIDSAAAEAALSTQNDLPEPTAAQKEAGNYRKGHTRIHGLDIAIENPAGSKRSGTDAKGKEWSVDMQDHYGYIKRTEGADGDHVDVFIGQNPASQKVFVVDQYKADGSFDEHKVVFGANDLDDAIETYSRNYSAGWNVGPVAEMSVDEFKDWLKTGDTKAPLTRFDEAPQNVLADFGQLRIEPYSEKSVVVRGDTKAYRDQLKNLKGTFNPRLKGGEGWVFGKARLDELTKALPGIVKRDERRQENEQLSAAPEAEKPDLFTAAYQRQNELAARARVHDADLAQRIETVLPPEQDASFDAGRVQTQLDKYEKQVALNEKREAIKRPKEKAEPAPQAKAPAPNKLDTAAQAISDKKLAAAEKLATLIKSRKGQLNSGIDPEVMLAVAEVGALSIAEGAVKFAQWVRDVMTTTRAVGIADEDVKPFLKEAYGAIGANPEKYGITDELADALDNPKDVRKTDIDAILTEATQGTTDETTTELGEPDQDRVSTTGRGRKSPAQSGAAQADPAELEGRQSKDGENTGTGGDSGQNSIRDASTDVSGNGPTDSPGDASNRRPRASRKKSPDAGSTSSRVTPKDPEAVSPANPGVGNFHLNDPLAVVGGTPVKRFERNKAAIELYNLLRDENRQPTAEEQAVLAAYSGWGSFGQELFQGTWARKNPKAGWEERDAWLREHLGQAEWEGLQRSITNSHYTDPPTVLAMWDMVRRMGFQGGRVLEPSLGIGNFFAMMPKDLKDRSQLAGIELDPLTGGIAQKLYPDANIQIKGYQESNTPDNFYDLIIGNWPFENTPIADRRYNRFTPMLHDYFFLKTLDQVRPGGLVIGITSKGSLDKKSAHIRTEMAKKAELVAAFRLPSGAFEQYAGTSVVTDIVILKKRAEPIALVAGEGWIQQTEVKTSSGTPVEINEYYAKNPTHVIGTVDYGFGTTSNRPGLIVRRPDDMEAQLQRVISLVPENTYQADVATKQVAYITNHLKDREGALVESKGRLFVVHGEYLAPANEIIKYELKAADATAAREAQLKAAIGLRQDYARLIEAETGATDGDTDALRKGLKKAYDAFVKAHGTLSESFALQYLKKLGDPFYPSLAALEDTQNGKVKPAAIFKESTIRTRQKVVNPSVADAFVLARNESVNPSLKRIAELANKEPELVKKELLDKKAVFELPNGDVVPTDIYLSGNVRQKMREARAALQAGNSTMSANIEALQSVMPADIPYFNIEVQMGASWIPKKYYAQYVAHMLNLKDADGIDVTYKVGRWKVDIEKKLMDKPESATGFGTKVYSFKKLVNAAFSNQTVTIRYEDETGAKFVHQEHTQEVNGKIAEMRSKFQEWIWADAERKLDIEQEYNEARNAYATPKFDGSFLSFQGMALQVGSGPFNLRQHQANAIWRALVTRKSLNAHEVGTGKTFTMAGIAVESRRYGLAKKPMILAHNANSKTVAAEIQMMYPAAKVLYIDNLKPSEIAVRMRQISNDDWDAVILPHSLISHMTLSEKTLMAMAQEEIDAIMAEAYDAAEEDGVEITRAMLEDDKELGKLRSATAKELVKLRNRIIENIKKQAQRATKDGAVTFEQLGIDMILVDEAHEFKKPPFATRMRMKGLNAQASDKSIALNFLTKYVRATNSGGNVHLFTGTPVTNTLTEVFHMQRYIMNEEMAEADVDQWDGWFGSFAREVMDIELNAAAEYEAVTRLAGFINVPELRQMLGQYMDIVFADDMPEMQPRKTATGKTLSDPTLTDAERNGLLNGRTEGAKDRPYKKIINETSDLTPGQQAAFEDIQGYARAWRDMDGKQRKEAMRSGAPESPIIYENLAAKASFDVRLMAGEANAGMEGQLADDPSSKASKVIRNVLDIYRGDARATQVIFMQQGISKTATRSVGPAGSKYQESYKVFSTAHDIIERLVQGGIPREQIALVDGSTDKAKRKAIADAMNKSEIRVVLGSSQSLGVGVNMQKNLRAMHHMDAPWMPGDLEQRNGRGHRQGNQWNTVLEYRYLTDRIDGRRWQVLAVKDKFIKAFLKGNTNMRVIEGDAASDEDSDILQSFSEAAGDPRILIRTKLQKRLEQLQRKKRLHDQGIYDALQAAKSARSQLDTLRDELEQLQDNDIAGKAARLSQKTAGKGFSIQIDGKTYLDRKEAQEAIDFAIAAKLGRFSDEINIGLFGGYTLRVDNANRQELQAGDSAPKLEVVIDNEVLRSKTQSLQSLEATVRNYPEQFAKKQNRIDELQRSIERAVSVSKEPFQAEKQLTSTEKELKELELDINMNPVAPPAWLRSGAPVETIVHWGGDAFEVTGHRWNKSGWYVLGKNESRSVQIPYLEAKDEQGMAVYEEREFIEPDLVSQNEKGGQKLQDSDLVDAPASVGPSSMGDSFGNAPGGGHISESLELRKIKAFVDRFDRRLADSGAGTQVVEYFAQLADHLPSEVVDQIDTDTQGFLYQNKVYLIGNRIRSLAHAQEVMIHERLRHAGVRKLFGNDFWKVMNKMAYAIGPRQLNLLAKKYGVDVDAYRFTYKRNRHPFPEAALLDEVIAHIKESDVPKGIWQKIKEILSMFRAILRNWGMSEWLDSFGEHDAEIMRVLKMAKYQVTDKGPKGPGPKKPVAAKSEIEKDQAFKRWFSGSQIVDSNGNPLRMYHGTRAKFSKFRPSMATNGLIFFTEHPEIANHYSEGGGYETLHSTEELIGFEINAREYAAYHEDGRLTQSVVDHPDTLKSILFDVDSPKIEGVLERFENGLISAYEAVEQYNSRLETLRSGGVVMPVYISAKNPAGSKDNPIPWREAEKKGAGRYKAEGYDAVYVTEQGGVALAVFEPTQIKSAVGNNGSFDSQNPDIAFSKPKIEQTGNPIMDTVSQINAERLQRWAQLFKPSKIGAAIKSKWQDYRPIMLQALPRNYLADIGGHLLPSLRRYNAQVAMMEAQRNDLLGAVHETADKWRKLVGKQPGASAKLADLMHEATLMGVDPSESKFTPAITRGTYEILMRNAKAFIKSRNGEAEAVARGMERRRKIQAAMDRVPTQERAYENMRKDFLALPPEHQALFMEVRDSYKKMNAERVTALEKRIEDLIADKRVAAAQISMMREEFEVNDLNGIYFPLQRFGKYKAVVKGKADGQVLAFSMFETHAQMREWMAEQESPDVTVQGGYQSEFSNRTDGVSAGFMKDLLQKFGPVLSKNNKIQDDLYQLFLEHSPDLSMRKHSIHRKGVAGFSEDALRAFAHNQFHSAYQIAKVSHTHHMQSHIIALDDEANAIEQTDDRVKAIQVVNELRQRNDWILSPKGSELANKLTGFGFFWYLGTSPAAALVNITQTAMVGLPVIGARYGFKETARVMGQMSKAFIKGKGNVDNTLTGRELSAFRELEKSGIIDKTMAHDMTGIAEGGISYSPKYHMVMKTAGWMFHHAERFNREVTAMSAYRLAFDKFKTKHGEALAHNLAVTEAIDMTRLSHFDYANSNRPRFMQGDVARVVLLFRQHSINMTYRLIRDFQQSFWGDGADKKIAQRQLAGMLGMTLFFAGAAGLPLYSVIAGIFNLMLDDEDDPFDFDDAVREVLAEAIGDTAASVIMSGAPGTALDVDLTNRVGMNNLWFRNPDADVDGEAAVQYYAEQVLGPMYGIVAGWGKALSLAREGHAGRAWEAAVPKFARDWFKSVRFADEGILTKRGDPIIDEVSPWQIALTANGFTSLEVSDQYRMNNVLSGAQRRLRDRRQLLLNRYALARRLSDQMAVNEALAEIERFNDAQPTLNISAADRVKSLKQRKRLSDRAVNGVVLDKKLAHLAE